MFLEMNYSTYDDVVRCSVSSKLGFGRWLMGYGVSGPSLRISSPLEDETAQKHYPHDYSVSNRSMDYRSPCNAIHAGAQDLIDLRTSS